MCCRVIKEKHYSLLGMVKLLCWNVRGLNGLNKKKEIKLFCNKVDISLMGFIETKIKVNRV